MAAVTRAHLGVKALQLDVGKVDLPVRIASLLAQTLKISVLYAYLRGGKQSEALPLTRVPLLLCRHRVNVVWLRADNVLGVVFEDVWKLRGDDYLLSRVDWLDARRSLEWSGSGSCLLRTLSLVRQHVGLMWL
jgi:hypothetical protein